MSTISKRHIKTANCAYVYEDGHCVIWHKESYKGAEVNFVTVHESAFKVTRGRGRLVIHGREALAHLLCADWIGWKGPSLANGSENTKKLGIKTATIYCSFKGAGETWITLLPDVISGEFTPQEEHAPELFETSSTRNYWGDHKITEVVRDKPKE